MTQVRKTLIPSVSNQVLAGEEKSPFTRIWFDFFVTLWERTGGPIDRFAENTPTGVITDYGGATSPDGWLLCDGAAVSRTTYNVLFGVIGTTYGVGNGTTTFNVPDLGGKVSLGVDGSFALASTGGSETTTLAITNLPAHSHGVTDPGHDHDITDPDHDHGSTNGNFVVDSGVGVYQAGANGGTILDTTAEATGISIDTNTTGITIDNTGSGTAFTNLPPYLALNKIIKI